MRKWVLSISAVFISFCFLNLNCKNSDTTNQNYRKLIDGIIDVDTIYEIKIDSIGTYIDSLVIHRIKRNEKGIKIFIESTTYNPDSTKTVIINYYRQNGELFYSMYKNGTLDTLSIYENWEENGNIKFGKSLEYNETKMIDSNNLKYKYLQNGGNKILYIQSSEDSIIREVFFDEMQKPSSELYLKNGDTLRHDIYIYFRGKLTAHTIRNNIQNTDTIRFFGPDEFYTSERIFINDSLIKKTLYERDSKGNILVRVAK